MCLFPSVLNLKCKFDSWPVHTFYTLAGISPFCVLVQHMGRACIHRVADGRLSCFACSIGVCLMSV